MNVSEFIVDLDKPACERWSFLVEHQNEINELLSCYLSDFDGAEYLQEAIEKYKSELIPRDLLDEIDFIASISNYSPQEVLLANLYYDVLKMYLGCTAFVTSHEGKVFHARNLDWWTDNNILSKYSKVFIFKKSGKVLFKTVGWFGFIGALSGVRPGCFSLTLNAVSSQDPAELAVPVSFLLREVLESAETFERAKAMLADTMITSDCLLLLAGTHPDQKAVIERTPTRSEIRSPENGFIAVTNDYKIIENQSSEESELSLSSCGRFERAKELYFRSPPKNVDDCFEILKDEKVMMGITVQQMVFDVSSGEIYLEMKGDVKY